MIFDILAGQPGLGWLILAAVLAGLVRGFAGFGTAMIFLPIAGQLVPPVWALIMLTVMDLIGPLPLVRGMARQAHLRDLLRLGVGLLVMLPFGILLLTSMAAESYRYAVSLIILVLLTGLVCGWRYKGRLSPPLVYGTGGLGGLLGGATGLAGPPVVMLYMASSLQVSAIRANIFLYLILADITMLVLFAIWGLMTLAPVVLGLAMAVPYLLANLAGAAMFRPEREGAYRVVAYLVIAASALSGLPLWDG